MTQDQKKPLGKIYRSSASQVSTFEMCQRKWAWEKIDGLRTPPNRYADYGVRVHKLLDAWFSKGEMPPNTPEGLTARAILRHLPPPQTPGLEVEKEISLSLGGVKFKGFIDLRLIPGRDVPLVSDHKTTGSFEWAKTPTDLPKDVQATLYGLDTMEETGCDKVELQWTYATRSSPRSLPVIRVVTRSEIEDRIGKTAETVAQMKEIYDAAPRVIDLPYNLKGCSAFGGCPFVNNCKLSPWDKFRSAMKQDTEHSVFLNRLNKMRANGSTKPTPAAKTTEVDSKAGEAEDVINPPEKEELAAKAAEDEKAAAEAAEKKAQEKKTRTRKLREKKETTSKASVPAETTPNLLDSTEPGPVGTSEPQIPQWSAPKQHVDTELLDLLMKQYRKGFEAGLQAGLKAAGRS